MNGIQPPASWGIEAPCPCRTGGSKGSKFQKNTSACNPGVLAPAERRAGVGVHGARAHRAGHAADDGVDGFLTCKQFSSRMAG